MVSILDFLDTDTGKEFVDRSSKEINESPEKVQSALGMALPMMLGALRNNTRSEEGAENLNQELEKEKHNGSVIDNLRGVDLQGLMGEGSGILDHIFGGKRSKIEEVVSSASGIESSKISRLLKMAAPLVMGVLGKQKRKDTTQTGGIPELIASALGTSSSHDQSLLETFLNTDSDKVTAKEMVGKLFGGKDKSKGLGSFFKG